MSVELYDGNGAPRMQFNKRVLGWLKGSLRVKEHQPPKTFEVLREPYEKKLKAILSHAKFAGPKWRAHRILLSNLSDLIRANPLTESLGVRLEKSNITSVGFRSALSQGVAKNMGENFINAITYALADSLVDQDEVLVDKGLPRRLRTLLTIRKEFVGRTSGKRELEFTPECDLAIFSRSNPSNAIVVSAKTRLKEVFHIGTMWKLFFDMIGDKNCEKKWGLVTSTEKLDVHYVFATADMILAEGKKTQGPDVERDEVRNLIAVDSSFFDYVFVSKSGIPHVAHSLDLKAGREALFHELGCLLDLVHRKFSPEGF